MKALLSILFVLFLSVVVSAQDGYVYEIQINWGHTENNTTWNGLQGFHIEGEFGGQGEWLLEFYGYNIETEEWEHIMLTPAILENEGWSINGILTSVDEF